MADPTSFFWADAAPGTPLSYEALQSRRRIAESLMGKRMPFPQNAGQGIAYLAEKLSDRVTLNALDEEDRRQGAYESALRAGAPPEDYLPRAQPRPGVPPVAALPPTEPKIYDQGDYNPLDAQVNATGPQFRTERNDEVGSRVGFDQAVQNLSPELQARMVRAYGAMPPEVQSTFVFNEGARPRSYQDYLYRTRSGRGAVAPPGRSRHEVGEAIDVDRGPALDWLHRNGPQYGLTGIGGDYPHIQLQRGGRTFSDPNNPVRLPLPSQRNAPGGILAPQSGLIPPDAVAELDNKAQPPGAPTASLPTDAMSDVQAPAGLPPDATAQANPMIQTDVAPAPSMMMPGSIADTVPADFARRPPGALGPALPPPDQGIQRAPATLPSQEPIPPAQEQVMEHPGPAPVEPPVRGPTPRMQYLFDNIITNPRLSPQIRDAAKLEYERAHQYQQAQAQREFETYKDAREAHQAATIRWQKHVMEAPDRAIKQQIDRTGLENTRAALEDAYYKAGLPRQQAAEKATLDILEARRKLAEPHTAQLQGTEFSRQYDPRTGTYGPMAVTPGAPEPENKLTEAQTKAKSFVDLVTPDLNKLELDLNHGKVLATSPFSALGSSIPGLGNVAVTPQYRAAKAAFANWAGAFMTHVSGAAITPSEAERRLPTFEPRFGDTQADLIEKSRRRRDFTESLRGTLPGSEQAKGVLARAEAEAADYERQKKLPPVRVNSVEDVAKMGLRPGRKLLLPGGNETTVPGGRGSDGQ